MALTTYSIANNHICYPTAADQEKHAGTRGFIHTHSTYRLPRKLLQHVSSRELQRPQLLSIHSTYSSSYLGNYILEYIGYQTTYLSRYIRGATLRGLCILPTITHCDADCPHVTCPHSKARPGLYTYLVPNVRKYLLIT